MYNPIWKSRNYLLIIHPSFLKMIWSSFLKSIVLYCPLKDKLFTWSNYKHLKVWKDSKNIQKILATICYIKTFLTSIGLRIWPSTSFVKLSNTWPIFTANCIWLYNSKTCSLNWHWHSSIHWRATEHVLSAPIGKYSSKVTLVLLHGSFIYCPHQIFLCFLIYYKRKSFVNGNIDPAKVIVFLS